MKVIVMFKRGKFVLFVKVGVSLIWLNREDWSSSGEFGLVLFVVCFLFDDLYIIDFNNLEDG